MSATLEGVRELEKGLNDSIKKLGTVNAKAFTDDVLDLLSKSVESAPVDTGDLRGSGSAIINGTTVAKGNKEGGITVIGSAQDGKELNAQIGFEEPYAVRQHEHTEYNHPQGGQAKYLEQPFRDNINKFINHIAEANKNALK